jgi:hypothetical protein
MGDPRNVPSSTTSASHSAGVVASIQPCAVCGYLLDSLGECNNPLHYEFAALRASFVQAPAPEESREDLISKLLFASRDLANANVRDPYQISREPWQAHGATGCRECLMHVHRQTQKHTESCRTGRVLDLLDRICATQVAPTPIRKEEAQSEASPRVEAGESPRGDFGEPWEYGLNEFYAVPEHLCKDIDGIVRASALGLWDDRKNVAERINACINFCIGIPTEQLVAEKPLADMSRPVHQVIALRRVFPAMPEVIL